MITLKTKEVDMCLVSKICARYGVKANITQNMITIYAPEADEIFDEICKTVNICGIKNFAESTNTCSEQKFTGIKTETENYDLRYPDTKYGEVYFCDMGEPYEHEIGYERPVIVVQRDGVNENIPMTIVIPCTSQSKPETPTRFVFNFSEENMLDYDPTKISQKQSTLFAEQIKAVDKKRLRKYVGTMTSEFMNNLMEVITKTIGA